MSQTVFIYNGDGIVEAIYVNNKIHAGGNTFNNPNYSSTWLDLIKEEKVFNEISERNLSNKAIQKYIHNQEEFPEYLSQFQEGELFIENYKTKAQM